MNEMFGKADAVGGLDAKSQAELELNDAWNKVDAMLPPDLHGLAHSEDESLTESAKHEALSAGVAATNDPALQEAWASYVRAQVKTFAEGE